jgi:hypothetical protein
LLARTAHTTNNLVTGEMAISRQLNVPMRELRLSHE